MNFTFEELTSAVQGSRVGKAKGRRVRNREAKEEALIWAATRLFASRGYEATTTREIAALAGCAEGLIHRYFDGKAGLLLALLRFHSSGTVGEMSERVPRGNTLEQEIQQVMEWEVERMWDDRDLLRLSIPQAIRDPKVGAFVSRVGPQRHAKAIAGRLRLHKQCEKLPEGEIEALAQAIGALGFVLGFMRPVVLGHDRKQARKTVCNLARIFSRGLTLQ